MNIFIRTDASVQIGSGHVMRCLTLASQLKENGANINFICRNLNGNLIDVINEKGFEVFPLPEDNLYKCIELINKHSVWLETNWQNDAIQTINILESFERKVDLLIVDHYALDYRWENQLSRHVKKIMVIDDLADRKHSCEIILDQNLYENIEERYIGLVPEQSIKLLGPQYALLRDEFINARNKLKIRDGQIKRILIFFGGSDPSDETSKALEAVKAINYPGIYKDVVVGSNNPNKQKVKQLCEMIPNTSFFCQVNNMAELMQKADLALGAGGVTTWERCCMGLPALIIAVAFNQVAIAKASSQSGVGIYLGESSQISSVAIKEKLAEILKNPNIVKEMARSARKLVDGLGVSRVCNIIYNLRNNQ